MSTTRCEGERSLPGTIEGSLLAMPTEVVFTRTWLEATASRKFRPESPETSISTPGWNRCSRRRREDALGTVRLAMQMRRHP